MLLMSTDLYILYNNLLMKHFILISVSKCNNITKERVITN